MTKHIHAELMKQYAEDAMTTDEPWLLWEYRADENEGWVDFGNYHPEWDHDIQYRRKPRYININGHEVPEPMRVAPKREAIYWIPVLNDKDICSRQTWRDYEFDLRHLSRGLIHSTREAAEAHARALLSFTKIED